MPAPTYYVSPTGSDGNTGTSPALPWKTIAKVNAAATSASAILFQGGQTFYGTQLSPTVSGTASQPVQIGSYGNGLATISGGVPVTGWTQNGSTGIWSAPFNAASIATTYNISAGAAGVRPLDVWFNGVRCTMASQSASTYLGTMTNTSTGITATTSTIFSDTNPLDIQFEFILAWTDSYLSNATFSSPNIAFPITPWANMAALLPETGGTPVPSYVWNTYAIFANSGSPTPGTFYHDRTANILYLCPPYGATDPRTATIMVPIRETAAILNGASGIEFTNIQFSHTTSLQPSAADGFVNAQASTYFTGGAFATHDAFPKLRSAVIVSNSSNITFSSRCVFTQIGGPGLTIDGTSSNCNVSGSLFSDTGDAGLLLGDPSQYAAGTCPTNLTINNNVFTNTGMRFKGSVPFAAFYVSNSKISHLDVSRFPYSGTSIGWGWGREYPNGNQNNSISAIYVHDGGNLMNDLGGMYFNGTQSNIQISNCVVSVIGGAPLGDAVGFYFDNGSGGETLSNSVAYQIINNDVAAMGVGTVLYLNQANGGGGVTTTGLTFDVGVGSNGNGVSILNGSIATNIGTPSLVGTAAAITAGAALGAGLQPQYADLLQAIQPQGSNPYTAYQSLLLANAAGATDFAYWPLNDATGSTTTEDLSGNGHTTTMWGNGLIFGQTAGYKGDPSSGAWAASNNSGANLAPSSLGNFGTGDFTIQAEVRMWLPVGMAGAPAENEIVSMCSPDAGLATLWIFAIETSNTIRFAWNATGAGGSTASTWAWAAPLNDGNWHQVAITRVSGTMTPYQDGAAISPTVIQNGSAQNVTIGSSSYYVGLLNRSNQAGASQYSAGAICCEVKNVMVIKGLGKSAASLKSEWLAFGTLQAVIAPPSNMIALSPSQVVSGTTFGPNGNLLGMASSGGGAPIIINT
jgi:Concanavalin A-like lectin/glucanases superfamily